MKCQKARFENYVVAYMNVNVWKVTLVLKMNILVTTRSEKVWRPGIFRLVIGFQGLPVSGDFLGSFSEFGDFPGHLLEKVEFHQ